jgi:hypothetical protein
MAGPRWSLAANGGWTVYVQALGGGTKITHEWANIPLKNALIGQSERDGLPGPEPATWIKEWDVNGFTTSASGVAAYDFNNGLQVRVADVGYRHSWVSDLQGRRYTNGLRFTFGVAYRMGRWDE